MPGYTHEGEIQLTDVGNVSTTLPFKANFIDGGGSLEISSSYNTGPFGFRLSYRLDNRTVPNAGITLLTESIEFADGTVGVFQPAVPTTHYSDLAGQSVVADSYIVLIDGIQHTLKILVRMAVGEQGAILAVESAPLEDVRVTPLKLRTNQIINASDRVAGFRSLNRFDIGNIKESNFDLLKRVEDSLQMKSNSSRTGIVNGASRELGLSVGAGSPKNLTVALRTSVTWGESQSVRLAIGNGRLKIFSNWVRRDDTKLIASTIEEVQLPGAQEAIKMDIALKDFTIGRLIDFINLSSYYECDGSWELYGEDFLKEPAYGLLPVDSREVVSALVPAEDILKLPHDHLIDRSLLFRSSMALETERAPTGDLLNSGLRARGDFWVDYEEGFIATKGSAGILLELLYTVNKKKIDVIFRGVEVTSLASEESQDSLFTQNENNFYTTHEERFTNGMPKNNFFKVLGQVLSSGEFSQYWGK
jgi:hypothetical protein